MSDQLRNCPAEFYNNCSNALIKCNLCGAGSGRPVSKVLYRPVNIDNLEVHPYLEVLKQEKRSLQKKQKSSPCKDVVKSKQIKEALRHERTLTDNIIKNTRRSGAEFGDGDKSILQGLIKMDDKRRFNTRSFTLSWDEYQKGLRQGLNSWSITVDENPGEPANPPTITHTVMILTLDAFTTLLSLAAHNIEDSPSLL
jgi:hypothetical protein